MGRESDHSGGAGRYFSMNVSRDCPVARMLREEGKHWREYIERTPKWKLAARRSKGSASKKKITLPKVGGG